MSELLHLQKKILDNFIHQSQQDLSFIGSAFPHERFSVYCQTIQENLRNTLSLTYPGIWRLLGERCANSVARAYSQQSKHLPKTGCLDDFGENFPDFLSALPQLSAYPYLFDYARYEWLKHLSYQAAEAIPLATASFNDIDEKMIEHLSFYFCPYVNFICSKYPLDEVLEIVECASQENHSIQERSCFGIVSRVEYDIHTYWVSEDQWQFCAQLAQGKTLLESAGQAQLINQHFDLSQAIAFLLQAKLLGKIIN